MLIFSQRADLFKLGFKDIFEWNICFFSDLNWILAFVKALSLPKQPLKMIQSILDKPKVRQVSGPLC
jgi:hypothetical protein